MTQPLRLAGETDDAPAINRWLAAGGGELTGTYTLDGPLWLPSGVRVAMNARLLYRTGWASAHAITARPGTRDVAVDFGRAGEIAFLRQPVTAPPRKGMAVRNIDGFDVRNVRVNGGEGNNLFALEICDSRNGKVTGGYVSVVNGGRQGDDGVHITGNVENVTLTEVTTYSGDDALSCTIEGANRRGSVQRNITFRNCVARNLGHSAAKLLIDTAAGEGLIEDILYENCRFPTVMNDQDHGAPFLFAAQAGTIRRVTVRGGSTQVSRAAGSKSVNPCAPVIQAKNVESLRFERHQFTHLSRRLAQVENCPGFEIAASCTSAFAGEVSGATDARIVSRTGG